MVDQLTSFAAEVTRVAREVGTEGKLGGQAAVQGVAGTWKDLTDNVNFMAANLTDPGARHRQGRDRGRQRRFEAKADVEAKGEIAALADTINGMINTLATFAEQVTTVAREVGVEGKLGGQANVPGAAGTWKDLTDNVNQLAANLTTQVRAIADVATAVTKGDLTRSIQVEARGEVVALKDNINAMIRNLHGHHASKYRTGLAEDQSGEIHPTCCKASRTSSRSARCILSELAPLVNAQHGVMYLNGFKHRRALSRHAGELCPGHERGRTLAFGPWRRTGGPVRCRESPILLTDVPRDYVRISSGLGRPPPRNLIVLPVLFEGEIKAVIELATLSQFTSTHLLSCRNSRRVIGIVLNTIEATMRTEGLAAAIAEFGLGASGPTERVAANQCRVRRKGPAARRAECRSRAEKPRNRAGAPRPGREGRELALTSKYKSEFLANMSHELRTPLNSILILAQQLAENMEGNLTLKQVEFARNVHAAGADLLNLISDILDLSKIESGTVTVEPEEVTFTSVRDAAERSFRHIADSKHLAFDIEITPELPHSINTDVKRLQQVLKNLLSNAFKFTAQGRVTFKMAVVNSGWTPDHVALNNATRVIAFEVSDTGIGISPDKQKIIFEAFHQADAGTSRRYGGTGLGLAISRELATLLGGEIRLNSAPGRGSIFTFYLPEDYLGPHVAAPSDASSALRPAPLIVHQATKPEQIADDREMVAPGDAVVLIVEDDPHFAQVLLGMVRERGLKGVVSTHGSHVRSLAHQFRPLAIMLDIFLPDMLGWTVLNQLKQDSSTRHIPVQIISVEEERLEGLGHGAFSYLIKPATTDELKRAFDRVMEYAQSRHRHLLVVEDNEIERQSIVELLSHDDVEISTAGTGAEALLALTQKKFDCLILDLRLPDISGFELMENIRQNAELRELPIVVCTGKDLTGEDGQRLARMAESVVMKDVQSPERLLDQVSLFLHLIASDLPSSKQQMLERLRQSDEALIGRKVLVVDDDVRNIFALTSLLEQHGVCVVNAENGAEAISLLDEDTDIDAVLMDIMMPEMDGYETMRRIRLESPTSAVTDSRPDR